MLSGFVFAYLSPETYLPVSSAVATVVGVVLMFGKTGLRLAARWAASLLPGRPASSAHQAPRPHFRTSRRADLAARRAEARQESAD